MVIFPEVPKSGRYMLLWESLMTGLTTLFAGLGLSNYVPAHFVGFAVIILQSLNAFTIAYKQGTARMPTPTPVVVNVPAVGKVESSGG